MTMKTKHIKNTWQMVNKGHIGNCTVFFEKIVRFCTVKKANLYGLYVFCCKNVRVNCTFFQKSFGHPVVVCFTTWLFCHRQTLVNIVHNINLWISCMVKRYRFGCLCAMGSWYVRLGRVWISMAVWVLKMGLAPDLLLLKEEYEDMGVGAETSRLSSKSWLPISLNSVDPSFSNR